MCCPDLVGYIGAMRLRCPGWRVDLAEALLERLGRKIAQAPVWHDLCSPYGTRSPVSLPEAVRALFLPMRSIV